MTVLYGTSISSPVLATACNMVASTGGGEGLVTTVSTGGQNFVEIFSHGSSGTPTVAAIGSASGNAWVYQLGAGVLPGGIWSASLDINLPFNGPLVQMTIRFFKYSLGTYTAIGQISSPPSGTIAATSGRNTFSFAPTSFSGFTFGATDLLYTDVWFEDTTGAGGDNPGIYVSSSSLGVSGDMQVTIPTFSPRIAFGAQSARRGDLIRGR